MISPKIRVVVADDELLARKFIRRMLKQDPEVEIIAECSNGAEAVATIRKEKPDLVFLDVQMPEMDGFAVLDAVRLDHLPEIVFTTAYESYAKVSGPNRNTWIASLFARMVASPFFTPGRLIG